MPVSLTLNGRPVLVDAPEAMPLLWVLRDKLGLTGTKYGCGSGSCWSCAVHLDGIAVPSCRTPLSAAAGKVVTTIEGAAAAGFAHVQAAWIAEKVPQCGWCQSGQILTAAALLARDPHPDDDAIDAAMRPVICRCGTYQRIRAAVKRAAETPR